MGEHLHRHDLHEDQSFHDRRGGHRHDRRGGHRHDRNGPPARLRDGS